MSFPLFARFVGQISAEPSGATRFCASHIPLPWATGNHLHGTVCNAWKKWTNQIQRGVRGSYLGHPHQATHWNCQVLCTLDSSFYLSVGVWNALSAARGVSPPSFCTPGWGHTASFGGDTEGEAEQNQDSAHYVDSTHHDSDLHLGLFCRLRPLKRTVVFQLNGFV